MTLITLLLVCGVALALPTKAKAACETVEVMSPTRLTHTSEAKPEIRWKGQESESHRLQVAVILPEGRIIDSIDTQVVGNRWAFGNPIPVPLAAIKVLVSRNCEHFTVQDLNAKPPHFFYDIRAECGIEPLSLQQTHNTLKWTPISPAKQFAITVFENSAAPGKPGDLNSELSSDLNNDLSSNLIRIGRFETNVPLWEIPATLSRKALVVSVQAQCNSVWSQARALSIKPATQ
jgi:hypothetical protein